LLTGTKTGVSSKRMQDWQVLSVGIQPFVLYCFT
jgi:hypothetical protein